MSTAVLFTFLQLLHTSSTHAITNLSYLKTPFFPIWVLVGKHFLFSVDDCPDSSVVSQHAAAVTVKNKQTNKQTTFSALSIAVSGSLSYPLVGEAACALDPSSAGNLLLQVWVLPSESIPTPVLGTGPWLSFASCCWGALPLWLFLCSDRTSSFPLAPGQRRVKKV